MKRLRVILGTIIVQMGLGTIYTWSLFNQPLVNAYGWKLNEVALTFSITSFALAIATLFAGKLQEKWGIRRLVITAGFVLGIGLLLSSQASSLWLLYGLAGVIVGFADGTAYITSLSNLIKWFPRRKGLISGISVGAYGTGSLIFKYINNYFIQVVGVSHAFYYWGGIVMFLVIGGALLLSEAKGSEDYDNQEQSQKNYSVKEMLQTKQAYLLFIIFFTACMSGLYLIGIVKDIGVNLAHLNLETAANAVALVAIFNTIGRIVLGALSDQVGRLKVIAAALFVTATAVTIISTLPLTKGIFFVVVAAIAFCFGGNITIFPALVADFFGLKNQSKNYGMIYQGFGLGALAASSVAVLLGGFAPTFTLIACLNGVSFIIVLFIKSPQAHNNSLPQSP
ncbi:major facilitator superfamily transporter [Fictibacillus macauensis ZFHKF-1]|uniref:Major facilitator superfamily transporter n=1 Tax=Fictibacillus macauensis ZFHKF-1 TaxID=1196324 RepID=I8UD22_9BACL|nr:OFA family MFS transporter [Fictibacillus macauensis]EIT84825.1 major facilitator superfamily transporter [Fictibacillus macauensis ZFHKF-1]